jgi:predicted ferric reductase
MSWFASIRRNKRKSFVLSVYTAGTVLLVLVRAWQYRHSPSPFVPLARASAAVIYLNFALLLLPMMRLTLSRSSHRWLNLLLPVHKAIESHQIAGHAMAAASLVHVLAYLGLYATNTRSLPQDLASHPANWTGLVLGALIGLLWWGAWLRRHGPFELFYYTHFLGIPAILLLFVHAPQFIWVMPIPLGLYLGDRLVRALWSAEVASIEKLTREGRDLALVIDRPDGFSYQAGDYAFLCVPRISRLQWHPFSLTNAASDTGNLSFRIRVAGFWTQQLALLPPGTPVLIDGPFASPCRDMHYCDELVIVAAGIGITPFVSYLAELHERLERGEAACARIALYWLERDEPSFAAFHGLMSTLQEALPGRFQAQLVSRSPVEGSLGLVTHRELDWDEELSQLGAHMPGATVFFCGGWELSEQIRASSKRAGMMFRTESF